MSRVVTLLLTAASLGFAPAPFVPPKLSTEEADLKAFQGEWVLRQSSNGNSKLEGDGLTTETYAGRSITCKVRGRVSMRWEIAHIDAKANPRRMELRNLDPKSPYPRLKCIYKFEGDRAIYCYPSKSAGDYPADFSNRGTNWVAVYKKKPAP